MAHRARAHRSFGGAVKLQKNIGRRRGVSTAIELRYFAHVFSWSSPSPPLEERVGERRPFSREHLNSTATGGVSSLTAIDLRYWRKKGLLSPALSSRVGEGEDPETGTHRNTQCSS